MVYTISMAEKPVPHISEADWKARIWNMGAVVQTKTANAFDLRNDVRQTRNEAVISRRWANYHNNARIADRLTEVRRWLNRLGGALKNLKNQSELLLAEKFETEKELEKYCFCLNSLAECRLLRDSKNKLNLVNDSVTREIILEVDVLEATKKYLSDKCFAAWEQNNRLVELIFKLESDLEDKMEAVEIDYEVLKLDNTSVSATYKPDVLRIPPKIWELVGRMKGEVRYFFESEKAEFFRAIPLETWTELAHFNNLAADNECSTTAKLRDSLALARERCKMDYLAQYEATNYALRRRSYETLRLKAELEYQTKNILDEMKRLSHELEQMTKCKEDTINYLKCAESRLEARNQRPATESTRDEAQLGLFDEILLLRKNIEQIDRKIEETKPTYNQMESYLLELETEIKYQEQSLQLDNESLQIHESLINLTPISQVDKNIELLSLSKEMPPERPVVR